MRRLTIIELPFATDRDGVYLRRCLADSWQRGELPFASHAFFPLWLDEDNPDERQAGIEAGYEFWQFAERVVFYVDHGMSRGMTLAHNHCLLSGMEIEHRTMGGWARPSTAWDDVSSEAD